MLFDPRLCPFEELPQIRHATDHGTCYGTRTGQETTHKQDDRACVSRRFAARRNTYAHTTNEEPDPSTSERTNERATHKRLIAGEGGQNETTIQPSSFALQSKWTKTKPN
jgi:hypothetical protein